MSPGAMRSLTPVRATSAPGAPHNGVDNRGTNTNAINANGEEASINAAPGANSRETGRVAASACNARKVASAGSRASATGKDNASDCSNSSALISTKQQKPTVMRASRGRSLSSNLSTSRPTTSAAPGARPKGVR